ncbi:stage V sporulation protein S [Deinococcus metalli]|uniref:Stage V sporulation protein S n=1 Tax=Deinococcus metalli TaxID=1141878 RepID=A0A7W8KCT2_9DEIO|nr:stage V sporulation protein S [Deinococcus metalli]MBB5375343.1 stage V sporulation protein S [Deinococcus metalli]GHF29987.1 stage V sporulation protein S [Deinococcus metalli]
MADSALPLEILRVSGTSRPNAIAGAVAALLRSKGEVDIQAIGPTAVNQTVKALAIARGYLHGDALDLYTQPEFVKLDVQHEERTAVRFHVRSMPLPTH